jgi:hypothetical protein
MNRIETLAGLGGNRKAEDINLCPHEDYCITYDDRHGTICLRLIREECQLKKFYDKYGNNYVH